MVSPKIKTIQLDNATVLIGMDAKSNDHLTFNIQHPQNSLWFHVADYPGSHVVLQSNNITSEMKYKASMLAKHYSKARDLKKINIHYCLLCNITKPPKSCPGKVQIIKYKNIFIN